MDWTEEKTEEKKVGLIFIDTEVKYGFEIANDAFDCAGLNDDYTDADKVSWAEEVARMLARTLGGNRHD